MTNASTLAVEWDACLIPETAPPEPLRAEVAGAFRMVPHWLGWVSPSPWLTRVLTVLTQYPASYIPYDLADLIALVVSQENSCRYCYGTVRAFLHVLGRSDAQIDRMERHLETEDLSPALRAALEFARRLARANPRPGPGEYARLREHWAPEEAAEIAAVACAICFNNRVATMLALPTVMDAPPKSWPAQMVEEVLGWLRGRPRAAPSPPPPAVGPAAPVLAALGRSPYAPVLRRAIDEALASDALPRRSKILMMATIGKALGCSSIEREARQGLAADGFSPAEVDSVMFHLGSDRLDEREARLVPFARDTVWYGNAVSIQRRVREATRGFTPAETLETVGVTALANLLGRLSVLLECC